MKRIGIVGGMSWESTAGYYKWINEEVRRKRGGLHSADLVMISVDFEPIEQLQRAGEWEKMGAQLAAEMQKLEQAGAGLVILATNTMHKMADQYEAALKIPFLHIGDAAAWRLLNARLKKIGLLGTVYTMEQDFYRGRLESHGLTVLIPDKSERDEINRIIYEELCQGIVVPQSRDFYKSVLRKLADQGCQAVILGCTEISMLVSQEDCPVPVFDTAKIHCEEAVKQALA
jgi:aspartate racemase